MLKSYILYLGKYIFIMLDRFKFRSSCWNIIVQGEPASILLHVSSHSQLKNLGGWQSRNQRGAEGRRDRKCPNIALELSQACECILIFIIIGIYFSVLEKTQESWGQLKKKELSSYVLA